MPARPSATLSAENRRTLKPRNRFILCRKLSAMGFSHPGQLSWPHLPKKSVCRGPHPAVSPQNTIQNLSSSRKVAKEREVHHGRSQARRFRVARVPWRSHVVWVAPPAGIVSRHHRLPQSRPLARQPGVRSLRSSSTGTTSSATQSSTGMAQLARLFL